MASNQTANLGLSQWEADDEVLRADFNADNAKIDAAVGALAQTAAQKADTAALTALAQTVAGKGNCTIVTGSYVGTGEHGAEHPCVLDFAATVGKPPLLVFVATQNAQNALLVCRGMTNQTTSTQDAVLGKCYSFVSWTETGLSWYNSSNASFQLNQENETYCYAALF